MRVGADALNNLAVFEPADIVALDFDYKAALADPNGLLNVEIYLIFVQFYFKRTFLVKLSLTYAYDFGSTWLILTGQSPLTVMPKVRCSGCFFRMQE